MKLGCVIQGNIRRGSDDVLRELPRHFDFVVLSTWKEDEVRIPKGQFEVILNDKPEVAGYSHRNYQRLSTAIGIEYAEQAGCTHILKWRTDMLPTKLDVDQLVRWSEYKVQNGMTSRVVTCAFRNLTVTPDWFSSIPDLFAFGSIDSMRLLWAGAGFDFSKPINVPEEISLEFGTAWLGTPDVGTLFCTESELYAHFKSRLQKKLGTRLNHEEIVLDHMYLIDHKRLGICWYGTPHGFRSIFQAPEHPWWTEKNWLHRKGPSPIGNGYPTGRLRRVSAIPWRWFIIRRELAYQKKCFFDYRNSGKLVNQG